MFRTDWQRADYSPFDVIEKPPRAIRAARDLPLCIMESESRESRRRDFHKTDLSGLGSVAPLTLNNYTCNYSGSHAEAQPPPEGI